MRLPIQLRHITNGKPRHRQRCPVALALRDHFNVSDVEVSRAQVRVQDQRFDLTESAAAFILSFDRGHFLQPCTLQLIPVEPRSSTITPDGITTTP